MPALRRQFFETFTLAAADMRPRFERRGGEQPRSLALPESVVRKQRAEGEAQGRPPQWREGGIDPEARRVESDGRNNLQNQAKNLRSFKGRNQRREQRRISKASECCLESWR